MTWMKRFAADSPIGFSFLTTVLLWLCYIAAGVAAPLLGTTAAGQQAGSAVGRLVAALIFLGLLWWLGWLRAAGITELGTWRSWLLVLPVLAYEVLAHLYAFFGSIALDAPGSPLGRAVALNGAAAGLLEAACGGPMPEGSSSDSSISRNSRTTPSPSLAALSPTVTATLWATPTPR